MNTYYFILDHPLLQQPVPADLIPGLHPCPLPQPNMQAGSRAVFKNRIRVGGREVLNTGVAGILVDYEDFCRWEKRICEDVFDSADDDEGQNSSNQRKAGRRRRPAAAAYILRPWILEFALGMLWPSQSFASISLFRGPTNRRLGEFHIQRFHAMSGEF